MSIRLSHFLVDFFVEKGWIEEDVELAKRAEQKSEHEVN